MPARAGGAFLSNKSSSHFQSSSSRLSAAFSLSTPQLWHADSNDAWHDPKSLTEAGGKRDRNRLKGEARRFPQSRENASEVRAGFENIRSPHPSTSATGALNGQEGEK
jgi:hypothetical protein